jgi:transcriptional regulator with XRE-family HTH domain
MATKSKWGVNMQRELEDLMEKYNLSREDVASKLGVSGRSIYRWSRGETLPQSRFIIKEFKKLKQELEKR